ncbi:uncharacterized protein DUF4123 [Cricetibacter osteomyelitidis]|uniref:Uncharacterized protein DUF4123 n=2 Tax=Cricetibacter osteomyelitidis TaxID=1521931 RepID=A0A4R2T4D5_9PAST|nr:DUF4123 domain-containing protein [Cricetibacter osteomyelitidis]TCP97200.1 uncharacterized protein DUF4123 [Cricetibacter osteomyelitidis]
MSEKILWAGYYRRFYQTDPNTHHFGYCLAFAQGRDDFQQKIETYCQRHQCRLVSQLAPLPATRWFERHGFNGQILQQARAIKDDSLHFLLQEEKQSTVSQGTYLRQQTVGIAPLPDVFHQPEPILNTPYLPPELRERGFFAHLNAAENPKEGLMYANSGFVYLPDTPRYYAIVDGVKSIALPQLCEREGRTESLYKGELKQRMDDNAPFLTQLTVNDRNSSEFVHLLFAQSEKDWFGLWDLNPAIFIRSYHDFEAIHYHFRKFTHLYNEQTKKWYFFRFYDPVVLVAYLQYIAKEPERLASFFGYREGELLIESVAARVGNEFHIFSLTDLPADTQPSAVAYDEFLQGFFIHNNNSVFAKELLTNILPTEFANLNITHSVVAGWLGIGQKMGFENKGALELFVKTQIYLQQTDITIEQLIDEISAEYGSITDVELSKLCYLKAKMVGNK